MKITFNNEKNLTINNSATNQKSNTDSGNSTNLNIVKTDNSSKGFIVNATIPNNSIENNFINTEVRVKADI